MQTVTYKHSFGVLGLGMCLAVVAPALWNSGSQINESIVIKDSSGRVRISIGLDDSEDPVIKLYGRNGEQEMVRLGAFTEDSLEGERQRGYGLLIGDGEVAAEFGLLADSISFCSVRSLGADGASSASLYAQSGAGLQLGCESPLGVTSVIDFSTSGVAANGMFSSGNSEILLQATENKTTAEIKTQADSGNKVSAFLGASPERAIILAQHGEQFARLRQLVNNTEYTISGRLEQSED